MSEMTWRAIMLGLHDLEPEFSIRRNESCDTQSSLWQGFYSKSSFTRVRHIIRLSLDPTPS